MALMKKITSILENAPRTMVPSLFLFLFLFVTYYVRSISLKK